MWLNNISTQIDCNQNIELVKLGYQRVKTKRGAKSSLRPSAAASIWKLGLAKNPMPIQMPQLQAAIVRTSAAGYKVSNPSAMATGALASGIAHYLSPSTPSITSSVQSLLVVPEFHELKDFLGNAFTGVLGAGMAYLRMIEDKFYWHAHYEESLLSPFSTNNPQPDFVFVQPGRVAVVESKGTGHTPVQALSAAKEGLVRQVHPAFTTLLSTGGYPTEGYAFGTSLGISSTPHAPIQMSSASFMPQNSSTSILTTGSASTSHAVQRTTPIGTNIQAIKRLNYQNALKQMGFFKTQNADPQQKSRESEQEAWEESLDFNLLAAGKRDDQLYFGPPIAFVWQDGELYAAQIAMRFGLLRRIKERDYPDGPEESDSSPVVGQTPGYWFVNFPDQVKVVFSPYIQNIQPRRRS